MELDPVDSPPPPRHRARRWIALGGLLVALAGGLYYVSRFTGTEPPRAGEQPGVPRVVPPGVRIRIEVLNATDTRGLARQAMFYLRDAGFDVVYFGNTSERTESTIIRDRSVHAEWAALAAKVMSPARTEQKPDSSHFLDLTVLVGRNWTQPRLPLYP
ncbi:MAG TPA: LytR C-terminal domain-containing protein [Gemmatimonadaceae bacterium]|nr:LytR C-terminal domain-containing protein [Gemmatimonadaceae bacterium]